MKKRKISKLLAAAVLASAALTMAACGGQNQPETTQNESTDMAGEDAQTTADAADTAEEDAGADASDTGALPAYVYPGNDMVMTAVCDYMVQEIGKMYPDGDIAIPYVYIVNTDESDPEDALVRGDFFLDKYNLNGDTLETQAGGDHPGMMHLKKTDDGYEVVSMDAVADGSDFTPSAKKIFGDYYDEFEKYYSDDQKKTELRLQFVADYVKANHLSITQIKDYGWDPVALP